MAVPGKTSGQRLSSTVFLASDEDVQLFCEPCDRDGPRLPAYGYCTDCTEHLCESCFHHHRATLSRHHILLDKDSMPQTQQLSTASVNASQSDDFTEHCAKHKKELIKFYCHDHKTLLCSVCVTLEHTVTSCRIDYIPDISGETVNSPEYHDTLKDIDTVTEKWQNKTEETKKMIFMSDNSTKEVLIDIKKFRKEIDKKMDTLERQAEDAVSDIQKNNAKRLETVEETYAEVSKSLKASAEAIKTINTSKQAERLFIELKHAGKVVQEQTDKLSQLSTSAYIGVYHFEPNKAISSFLETEVSLATLLFNTTPCSSSQSITLKCTQKSHITGALSPKLKQTLHQDEESVKSEQMSQQEKTTPKPTKPAMLEDSAVKSGQYLYPVEIPVKTSKDKVRCWITGMALFPPSRLIVTDHLNLSAKMVDTQTQYVMDQIELTSEPWDVALVTNNVFAITLPVEQRIQFISALSSSVAKLHTWKVDGKCKGISCYQNKIVVSFEDPGKLQILDMSGKLQTTTSTVKVPNYVRTNGSSIYVSDRDNKAVVRFNWQGHIIGQYNDIDFPAGLVLNEDGSLYVCDHAVKNAIHKLSGDCIVGKIVLMDLNRPFALCWCNKESKLYVSSFTREAKYDNYINIYKM
ncbi:uncharacterized protein LOC123560085 [Mercenaria mercenaria]|uniref:uncharacterized protein LOC123560085 n=1 Tax=Mercenaria mercenaria TaxID=6596 RepID=UPI00234EA113|nr:uncharacterized protein LOC123560085 [Mercenaria mercenaria]